MEVDVRQINKQPMHAKSGRSSNSLVWFHLDVVLWYEAILPVLFCLVPVFVFFRVEDLWFNTAVEPLHNHTTNNIATTTHNYT